MKHIGNPVIQSTERLRDFLQRIEGRLTLEERKLIVRQAIFLFKEHYAHLPLKRSMHAVDPVQRLRLLALRLAEQTDDTKPPEIEFHREMHSIFTSVRDLHTRYFLPEPYRHWQAFLPFGVGECFEEGELRYLLIDVRPESVAPEHRDSFVRGAEILSWNGVPIGRAIELLADRYSGSNLEARRARGLARLTIRPLALALPPEEEWVRVGFRTTQESPPDEIRFFWQVAKTDSDLDEKLAAILRMQRKPAPPASDEEIEAELRKVLQGHARALAVAGVEALEMAATSVGMDTESEWMRRQRSQLYPQLPAEQYSSDGPGLRLVSVGDPKSPSRLVAGVPVLEAFTVVCERKEYGLIQIHSFDVPSVDAFVDEFKNILEHHDLGRSGLIIDVRGNGGGKIPAGERLLQMLTPVEIEPARLQFVNTPRNLELCRRLKLRAEALGGESGFEGWIASIDESVATGETYSRGFPLTPRGMCNDLGQRYHGPTVLVTDANCYSTTDIFVAGYQDHGIGTVLGVHENTGAGGANNVLYSDLVRLMGGAEPYRPLPHRAEMNVALRRTLRVHGSAGRPLEDLGVRPDEQHRLTRDDLLHRNQDLYQRAIDLLQKPTVYLDGWLSRENVAGEVVPVYMGGWFDQKQGVGYLCTAPRSLRPDYLLNGIGEDSRNIERSKTMDCTIQGLEAHLRAFHLGDVPLDALLEVRMRKAGKGPVVAVLRQKQNEGFSEAYPDVVASTGGRFTDLGEEVLRLAQKGDSRQQV